MLNNQKLKIFNNEIFQNNFFWKLLTNINYFKYFYFFFKVPIIFKFYKIIKNFFNFFSFNFLKNTNFAVFYKNQKNYAQQAEFESFTLIPISYIYHSLLRFLEYYSGKKIFLKLIPHLNYFLTFDEKWKCLRLSLQNYYYRKRIKHTLFLFDGLQSIFIMLRTKNLKFLLNWLLHVLANINFWKYRLFLHFLKKLFENWISPEFHYYGIKGIKFQFKGKINVAGNSRTRTVVVSTGKFSFSKFDNKIFHIYDIARTHTGAIGINIWLVF